MADKIGKADNVDKVVFIHEGRPTDPEEVIDIGMLNTEIRNFTILCKNESDKAIINFRILSNLPPKAYTWTFPKIVQPHTQATLYIALNGKALWDVKLDGIAFSMKYDLLNEILT